MSEPREIEPHYQAQAKRLVDVLFDKGYFSDTLSRDGMDDVEGLLALYLQLGAESAARCAEMNKKFKARTPRATEPWEGGEDLPRHEGEIRWIQRARESEARVAELETSDMAQWALEVGGLLKTLLSPPYCVDASKASDLFMAAIEKGIIPEPDCEPGRIRARDELFGGEPIIDNGCKCQDNKKSYPGAIIQKCMVCGGGKIL